MPHTFALKKLVDMEQHSRRYLVAILLLSVLLRVAFALYLGDIVDAPPLLTDQRSYHWLGDRLIRGHGFSFGFPWYPFTPANTPTAHWSFLYSLFVAAVYALFGPHPLAMRLVQAVLGGLLLPWMVYRLARRVFGLPALKTVLRTPRGAIGAETLSLVAAAMAACYLYFVMYAATLMTETFYIVALLWSLEVGLGMAHRLFEGKTPSFGKSVQLGVSLAMAALLRQSILPWVPFFFLYLLWLGWRNKRFAPIFGRLVLSGVLLVAAIAPWTYRNYRVYGQFLLLNSNTGYAMYSAQHPMHGTRFREFDAAPLPQDLAWGNEALMDRELLRRGMQFVMDEPGRYLLLSLSRVRAYFEFWPTPDTSLLHNLGRVGSFGLLLPFLLYGLFLALRRPSSWASNGLLFLFAAFYIALHLLTWAMVRYRLPVDAAWMPLASWAAVDLLQRAGSLIRRQPEPISASVHSDRA
jgi:hypothetical protein